MSETGNPSWGTGAVTGPPSLAGARAIVSELIRQGVEDFVLCPGSRNAPLVYAVYEAVEQGLIKAHVRVDERTAGFFAIGLSLSARSHRPVAVATTSGTATANLHPAVLEASYSNLPLIILTADRPEELHGVGANQTCDQVNLYGTAVRYADSLPAVTANNDADLNVWHRAALLACEYAEGRYTAWPGPAHINCQFRDPLVPDNLASKYLNIHEEPYAATTSGPDNVSTRPTYLPSNPEQPPVDALHMERDDKPTVVIAGTGAGPRAEWIAREGGWPLFAEPSSGARFGPNAISPYRLLLTEENIATRIERVIVVGRPTLSRPVTRLVSDIEREVIVVHQHGGPHFDIGRCASAVVSDIDIKAGPINFVWLDEWKKRGRDAESIIVESIGAHEDDAELIGPLVTYMVANSCAADGVPLFSAASHSIRDLDLYTPIYQAPLAVYSNRGLAGIDGTMSAAGGLARGLAGPVRVLTGDLAFIHDLGGLIYGELEISPDLQIICMNDGGGSIFSTLEPGAPQRSAAFERFFATPQFIDCEAAAQAVGAAYTWCTTAAELREALAHPIEKVSIIEVPIPRSERREFEGMLLR